MRRRITLLLLCTILTVLAAGQLFAMSIEGIAGVELEYSRIYNSNTYMLQSNSINVKAIGSNFFGEKGIIGLEYGIGYIPFQSDARRKMDGFSLNNAFVAKYDANDILSLHFAIGSEYYFQHFDKVNTHTLGLYTSSLIEFKVIKHLSLGLKGTYHLPIFLIYGNTSKCVAGKNQIAGISFFMTYSY